MSGRITYLKDLNDPALDVFARLTEAQLRHRREEREGVFIAESPAVILRALEAGCEPLSLLMEEQKISGTGAAVLEHCPDVPVYTASRELLASLTGYALTRGILCAFRRPAPAAPNQVCEGAKRVAVLENIVDASNVGAIFRSAAALGMDAVLLTPSCADPLLRRAARVSMGTVFQIPWARLKKKSEEWPHPGLELLKEMGFSTAALALGPGAIPVNDPTLANEERLALLLGTEGTGLLPETIRCCDYRVIIPMSRGVDSLNVAAASAVAFWVLGNE